MWAVLVVILLFCAIGAVVLRSLAIEPLSQGYGCSSSPENLFFAEASTKTHEAFWGGKREFFKFRVSKCKAFRDGTKYPWGEPLRTLTLDRVTGLLFPTERGIRPCNIRWSPDASEVTFDLQGASVSISTNNL